MENKISPVEAALVTNDLSKLTTDQRMSYYKNVCDSLGLNYLTQPFAYISLNGKLTLYAKRDATDQLRQIHNISINITSRELIGDVYIVTAKARNASGREDESMGTVSIANLKGDALANAYLKCETKAKRRVTLSICGLGLMDDTEVETIKEAVLVNEPIKIEEKKDNGNKGIDKGIDKETTSVERLSDGVVNSNNNERAGAPPVSIKEEIKTYPDKTKIKINKEQAENLKTIGENIGYTVEQISHLIYTLTKKIRWSELNYDEYEVIVKSLKDKSNMVL